jgi:hypothetical protein
MPGPFRSRQVRQISGKLGGFCQETELFDEAAGISCHQCICGVTAPGCREVSACHRKYFLELFPHWPAMKNGLALTMRKANPIIRDSLEFFSQDVLWCSRHHLLVATSATAATRFLACFFSGFCFLCHRLGALFFGHLLSTDLFLGHRGFFSAAAAGSRTGCFAGTNCAV